MPTYVVLLNWTEQGVKGFKDSPSRAGAAQEMMQLVGVTLNELYWTIGPYDLVAIADAPDDESLTAAMLSLGALGNVRSTTLRAFSQEEFVRVVERAS
jgi:uncharacterized protein with GYD domain